MRNYFVRVYAEAGVSASNSSASDIRCSYLSSCFTITAVTVLLAVAVVQAHHEAQPVVVKLLAATLGADSKYIQRGKLNSSSSSNSAALHCANSLTSVKTVLMLTVHIYVARSTSINSADEPCMNIH
jgi:hypothetical protein